MDLNQNVGGEANELFEAQSHIYRHALNYAISMSLGCALELGIPDVIHNHEKPITIQELVSKLNLPIEKTLHLKRLMCLLVHSNFFSITRFNGEDQERYVLTLSSKLLLKNSPKEFQKLPNLLTFVKVILNPVIMTPWRFLGKWFHGSESTVFETANGVPFWEFVDKNPAFCEAFNEGMASDSEMMNLVVKDTNKIFEGVTSLVDVGGGTGLNAKIILETFPHMTCIVFDLPRLVHDMIGTGNLKYVGGDMFSSIPSADAIFLKNVLHDWSDEDVLKILKRCREAIPNKGKVVIIDMVVDQKHDSHQITETKLVFDILMMVLVTGKERTKGEWEKLFVKAGFSRYKITPIFGLRSLMEIFP